MYIGFPDEKARLDLIEMNQQGIDFKEISNELKLNDTQYYSCSDIIAFIKEFHLSRLNSVCKGLLDEKELENTIKVEKDKWKSSISTFRPGQTPNSFKQLEEFYMSFKEKKPMKPKNQKQILQ